MTMDLRPEQAPSARPVFPREQNDRASRGRCQGSSVCDELALAPGVRPDPFEDLFFGSFSQTNLFTPGFPLPCPTRTVAGGPVLQHPMRPKIAPQLDDGCPSEHRQVLSGLRPTSSVGRLA